ncbi:LysR family transcriptional regulator [Microvirga antarctica]|uniref:LysR family transcriptional regulator n=1 Tax=Microvirga antarctica TaxID=2819233 RepID=UPI001B30083B|nr:LysR substrate-binding domain-containing protein [Microvirga antarctica]
MNVREIEIFRAVMQEGSVSRAAKHLRISQPAASKYIAQLERRLGLPLFVRSGSGLLPTPEARALFDQVDRLFLGLAHVEQFMHDLAGEKRGHLTVASLPLLAFSVMPDLVASFMKERPGASIALQTRSSARIIEWVAAGQVDLGVCFCFSKPPGIVAEPLVKLELFCAVPPGDPLEDKTIIEIGDLEGRDLITYDHLDRTQFWLDALLDKEKVYTRRRIQVFWTSIAMELVMRGLGIAIVDRLTASQIPGGMKQLRPFRPSLTFDLDIVRPEHWPSSAMTSSFAEMLRRHLNQLLEPAPILRRLLP